MPLQGAKRIRLWPSLSILLPLVSVVLLIIPSWDNIYSDMEIAEMDNLSYDWLDKSANQPNQIIMCCITCLNQALVRYFA